MNRAVIILIMASWFIAISCVEQDRCPDLPEVSDLNPVKIPIFENLNEIKFFNTASRSETLSFSISRDTLFTRYDVNQCPQFSENIYTHLQEKDSKTKVEAVQYRVYSDSLRIVQDLQKIVVSNEEETHEYLFNEAYLVDWTGFRLYQREAVFQRDSGLVQFELDGKTFKQVP